MKNVYTPVEVAKVLGVSAGAIYYLINTNKIKSFKLRYGNRKAIMKEDLIDYMERNNYSIDLLEKEQNAFIRECIARPNKTVREILRELDKDMKWLRKL